MNKKRPTPHRVEWSSEALNEFMPVHSDIDNLRITKEEREEGFANGTEDSANIMYRAIVRKLTLQHDTHTQQHAYRANFWYTKVVKITQNKAVSNLMEEAFNRVVDLYLKHQGTWDDAEEIEEFVEGEDDSEEEESSDEEETNDISDI